MKTTIDFWCDQILIWSACLWAHQKFSEILSLGPASKPSSCSVEKGWENNLSVWFKIISMSMCSTLYIRFLSVQDNIQEHYEDTAPTSNISEQTKSCHWIVSHKASVRSFPILWQSCEVCKPRALSHLMPPILRQVQQVTRFQSYFKRLQMSKAVKSSNQPSVFTVYTVWHIDADDFT